MTPSRAIFLTGFMGAGKTSVGAELARRRGCAFHDLDAVVVERAGKTVAQIFATGGETEFRRLESEALREVLASLRAAAGGAVVALGGGTLAAAENVRALREADGILVALDAPVELLFERTRAGHGTRPLAREDDEAGFRKLYEARRPLYRAAEVSVESGNGDVRAVAERVEEAIATLLNETS